MFFIKEVCFSGFFADPLPSPSQSYGFLPLTSLGLIYSSVSKVFNLKCALKIVNFPLVINLAMFNKYYFSLSSVKHMF